MKRSLWLLIGAFMAFACSACVQTVEPSAEDEMLIKAQDNVATMPSG